MAIRPTNSEKSIYPLLPPPSMKAVKGNAAPCGKAQVRAGRLGAEPGSTLHGLWDLEGPHFPSAKWG